MYILITIALLQNWNYRLYVVSPLFNGLNITTRVLNYTQIYNMFD